jgi:hypothetical protein
MMTITTMNNDIILGIDLAENLDNMEIGKDIDVGISTLIGKTLARVDVGTDQIDFVTTTGEKYAMYHSQDCCENVIIEDVAGDMNDLLNSPVTDAREETNAKPDNDPHASEYRDSFTWTFYIITTAKGSVTIRWYGESNGYYSESVDFRRA